MKNKILSLVLAVLCMVSIMPFTAIVASAADYGLRPIFAENISNFEDPWSQAGNYKVQGVIYGVDEFDGETVKGIYNQILDETYNDLFKVGYKLTFYNSNGGVREINNLTDFKNFLNSSNSSNYYIDDPTDYEPSTLVTDEYQYRVDYNYKVKNNTLYALSSSYSLQNGVLAVSSLVSNEIDEMYNLNKFLTNNEIQLFTRYKYLTDDSQTIDNILQPGLFDGHTFPTSTIGGAYYFTESVSISIGGGTVYLTFVDGLDDEGNPNNEIRDEINTGGIVVLA